MDAHAMFGDLDLFRDGTFFQEHPYGNLYYEEKDHGIEFVAFLNIDAYDSMIYNPGIEETDQKKKLLDRVWSKALWTRGDKPVENEHLVFLSTCASGITNGRYVLVGRIKDEVFENPYKSTQELSRVDKAAKVISLVPVWMWVLLILIIILLFPTINWEKKRETKRKEDM